VQMRYEEVRAAAARGDEAADAVPGRTNTAWSAVDQASCGSRGLAAAAALDRCRDNWSARLKQLSTDIQQHADYLRVSVNECEAADVASAQAIGRIGSDR
jgi:hypothetical protein